MSEVKDSASRILAIETSCDETAAAVVDNGQIMLSNVIASQADLHAQYGGIFPEVASRKHIEMIYPVVDQAMREAFIGFDDLDCIAVTRGPGLVGSLLVAISVGGTALADARSDTHQKYADEVWESIQAMSYHCLLYTSDAADELT